MSDNREPKSIEDMTTTASYVLTIGQVRWIDEETERIKAQPNAPKKFNKSAFVRELIDQAMADDLQEAAA